MIGAEQARRDPSKRIKLRSAKMRSELLQHLHEDGEEIAEVRVEPDEIGKPVRIVSFHRIGNETRIACFDEITLVACDGNRFGVLCSHVYAAIEMLLEVYGPPKEVFELKEPTTNESES